MTKDQRKRLSVINKTLSDAMAARSDCNWSHDTEITRVAQANLDEAETQFVFENGTREQVRSAYKKFAEAHVR